MAGRGLAAATYGFLRPGRIDRQPARHFYLWAALIRDGQLVSVDYAPDVGWPAVPEKR